MIIYTLLAGCREIESNVSPVQKITLSVHANFYLPSPPLQVKFLIWICVCNCITSHGNLFSFQSLQLYHNMGQGIKTATRLSFPPSEMYYYCYTLTARNIVFINHFIFLLFMVAEDLPHRGADAGGPLLLLQIQRQPHHTQLQWDCYGRHNTRTLNLNDIVTVGIILVHWIWTRLLW